MARAIIYGLLFVILCVAIPGVLGLVYNTENRQDESERKVEESVITTEKSSSQNRVVTTEEEPAINSEDSMTNQELVFTKEEAVETVLDQFSLTEILSLYSQVKNGVDAEEKEEILAMLEEHFTDEEIEALKVIGFSELEKVLQ